MNGSHPPRTPLMKSPSFRWLCLSALVLILAILLNLLVSLLPSDILSFDMTATKLTDLTDSTRDYVKKLDQSVTIHHICITGNEDEGLRTMLDRYDELSDKLSVKEVDPAVRPTFLSAYTDQSLADNSIIVESAKRYKVLSYTDFLIYTVYATDDGIDYTPVGEMLHADFSTFYETYLDYFSEGYYSYDTQFMGERAITSAIDYVTGDVLPKVYALTGHGESTLSEALLGYLSFDNIDIASLSLPTADAIPSEADALILYAPQTDLGEAEADLLRDYLIGGGNLILLTDYTGAALPNLTALMKTFGMEAQSSVIKEGDSAHYYALPYYLLPDTAGAHSLYELGSYSLLMPYAHPIAMTECEYTMTYTSLFSTSDKAILEALEVDEDAAEEESAPESARYDIGALVKLQTEAGSGKLCWLSSPELLSDTFNSEAAGGNFTYFMAILESMCGKTSSIAIDSKAMSQPSLVLTNGQAAFWAVVIIGLIPLSLPIIGAVVRARRRRR